MAKATHASGPTFTEHEQSDGNEEAPAVRFRRAEIGYIDRPEAFDVDPANAKNSSPNHAGEPDAVINTPPEEDEEETKWPNQADGTGSSQSSKKEPPSSESNRVDPRSPARTTESPSNRPETEPDSSADSTDTDGPNRRQTPSSRPRKAQPPRKANPRAARVRSTDDDEFDI